MIIRNATYKDAPAIKFILESLGYKTSNSLLVQQLENIFGKGDNQVYVYASNNDVLGFVSIHFMPQLAFNSELVLITHMAVLDTEKNQHVEKALEQYIVEQAKFRKCERIQVHIFDWCVPVQQFYIGQGYQEFPKYFTKRINYGK